MFDRLIQFSLRNRLFVIAAAALVLVYGVIVIRSLPVDVFPDLNRPTVTVMSEAGGLSPEEVEVLVTRPIEVAMNGAPGVTRVRSTSGIGLSVVYVEFAWGTDIYLDRQLVAERLQTISQQLPEDITPIMAPVSSIMGEIMLIGLKSTSEKIDPMELRTLADWTFRQRLLTVPGVSQVVPIGGGVKQFQVLLSSSKMASYGITLDQVESALQSFSVNTSGGFMERQSQEYLVRNLARTADIDDLANVVVDYREGVPILLRQVAEVKIAQAVKRGDAGVDGEPAVIMSIQKQPGANTVEVTEKVHTALDELRSGLSGDIEVVELFKQANFIEAAVGNVEEALRDGTILVVIVLFLFLLNFRTTAITLTAIPLSLVITALVMKAFEISINTMTLGGLAVAIGELVDDAIVDVENVFRRLKENRHASNPLPALKVIYRASSEVRNSIVFATIIVILVFIPLFAMGGIEGRLFAPLGIAYVTSILASLVVSLTVTPALCSYLLPKARFMERHEDSLVVRWLKALDKKLLAKVLHHPKMVLGITAGLVAVALASTPFLGREFLPPFNEGTATINLILPPGSALSESNRVGSIAEKLILEVPEVASTGRRTGRAELDEHAEGVHYTEIDVDFKESDRTRAEILGDIRRKLDVIPGAAINIGQPISHRLDHLLSGVRAQIAVKVFGNELSTLRAKAEEVRSAMSNVPGVVDLQIETQVLVPQVKIDINRTAAAKYGLNAGAFAERLEKLLQGEVVSQVLDGQQTFNVLLRTGDMERSSLEQIGAILIDTPSGAKVPISAVADVVEGTGPNMVNHEDTQRRIVISANVAEQDLGTVVQNIQRTVSESVQMPQGYYVTYGGQFESQQSATRTLGLLSIVSFALMFLVLYSHFRSARIVAQVLLNIPLAVIGSIAAVWLTGGTMSVATLVGFITLTGIASRNTIMMISHYIHLVKEEGEKFDEHMVIRGSLERLVPVLMTALTAGLALVPLVLAQGEPGKEILYPVATVILGGLISSTLLDMIVTPTLFFHFGRNALAKYLATHNEADWESPAPASNT